MELNTAVKEATDAYNNVEKWAKPERVPFSLDSSFTRPTIRKDPKGVVLIIVPFNYPIFLALSPLVRSNTCDRIYQSQGSKSFADYRQQRLRREMLAL
jgi:hypothetical protein